MFQDGSDGTALETDHESRLENPGLSLLLRQTTARLLTYQRNAGGTLATEMDSCTKSKSPLSPSDRVMQRRPRRSLYTFLRRLVMSPRNRVSNFPAASGEGRRSAAATNASETLERLRNHGRKWLPRRTVRSLGTQSKRTVRTDSARVPSHRS